MERRIYSLAGLRIVSDFPLIGVQVCPDEAASHAEIVIHRARISEALVSASATIRHRQYIGTYNGRDVLLDFPNVGRFFVRDGKEILIDALAAADEGEVRAYLLGIAFGVLCHQRGIVPLHASAVDVVDGCAAFVGDSGAGKSTLVAALAGRGHEVIADDLCFLQLDQGGNLQAWPGIGHIRLWEQAMHALGCGGRGAKREIHGYNKFLVPVRTPQNPLESRRLRRIYQLHRAHDRASEVTRLYGTEAVEVLMQNVYRMNYAENLGYKPNAFMACIMAARNVPVFRFSRPLRFDALNEGIEVLEDHIRNRD